MTDTDRDHLRADVKIAEGWRAHAYRDSEGVLTIGYGTNLQELEIDPALGEQWLLEALSRSEEECERAFPWFTSLSGRRQRVLVEMVYNMGLPRLLGFRRMLIAILVKAFEEAAREMLASRWADQVGQRAVRLATQMREG
jgi:lysozyme